VVANTSGDINKFITNKGHQFLM